MGDLFRLFLEKHTRTRKGRPIRESSRRETARIAPVKANRTLTALKTFFTWLVRRDVLPKSPCDGIGDPAPENGGRDRVLTDAELAALWRAAGAAGYPYGCMVRLLVLTGCRRNEVRGALWDEFDLDKRTWLLPAHRTKNGRDHLVPLTDAMLDVLEGLPRIEGSKYLFTTTGDTAISGLTKYKRRLHEQMTEILEAEPSRWTLHDLRRTFVTGLQRRRFSLEVAEACVNHASGAVSGVAAVYARHDYAKEKHAALQAWARHVLALGRGKADAKVVPLQRRTVTGQLRL